MKVLVYEENNNVYLEFEGCHEQMAITLHGLKGVKGAFHQKFGGSDFPKSARILVWDKTLLECGTIVIQTATKWEEWWAKQNGK
jgi:hypothetical protein